MMQSIRTNQVGSGSKIHWRGPHLKYFLYSLLIAFVATIALLAGIFYLLGVLMEA